MTISDSKTMHAGTPLSVGQFIPSIGRFLPESIRLDPTDLWKAENLAVAGLMAMAIMSCYGLFYWLLGDGVSGGMCFIAVLGAMLSMAVLHWIKSIALSRELLVLSLFVLLVVMSCRLGGVSAPTVIWLAICPLIATTVGGLRPALAWSAISFAAVIAIHVLDSARLLPPPVVTDMRLLTTVSTVFFVITVAVFILIFYHVNAVAVIRLDRALTVIRDLAIRDELTGVFNRRELIRVAEQQKSLSDRQGAPFNLCLIDVDYFKRINDTYGHAAGDMVLRRLSARVQAEIRRGDCFGRYGGEEFLLLLVGSDARTAHSLNERIRLAVQDMPFDQAETMQRITVSIGVAQYSAGETIQQTLIRADRALYSAKLSGRNRVVVSE